MTENRIVIDFETRSTIDLKRHGRNVYMKDKHFKPIIMAVKKGYQEPIVYSMPSVKLIKEVIEEAIMFDIHIVAHNAAFEINTIEAIGVDSHTKEKSSLWRDTMVMCQYHGIPYSLENAGKYLNLKTQKLNIGKELINLFTKPIPEKVKQKLGLPLDKIFWEPEDKPEQWISFCEYCKYDVNTASEIADELPEIPEHVWDEWLINLNINRRGVLIDREFCKIATDDLLAEEEESLNKLRELTGLDNPKSRAQLKVWFKDFSNLTIDSLNKEVITELLANKNIDTRTKEVLSLFSIVSKTSTAKYTRFQELADNENKIYDILNFYGARTGRWSSWGVQLHNMKRINLDNYKELRAYAKEGMLPMLYTGLSDIYSQLVRTAIIAPLDKRLVIADFAQIEARVLQWLANDQQTLDIFRSGKDYYTYTAAQMFNKKYDDIPKDSEERRKGKVAALALGYGGAIGALDRSPAGKEMTPEEKVHLVKLWRKANSKVVKFWDIVNAAFIKTFVSKQEVVLNVGIKDKLVFRYALLSKKPAVTIELPSGRVLWYLDVKVHGKGYVFYGKSSDDQFTETYINIYGGFLTENITQAIARDCLQVFINRLTKANYPVVFHVHDEVIVEISDKGMTRCGEALSIDKCLVEIENISKEVIYEGLPVIAEPKVSEYYDK